MVEFTGAALTPDLKEIMKRSLKKDRWQPLDLGAPANYTEQAIVTRWEASRSQWVHVSSRCANLSV